MLAIYCPIFFLFAILPSLLTATRVGGIDMQRACREEYACDDCTAVVKSKGCDGWRCKPSSGGVYASINTPKACVSQYGAGTTALCGGLFVGGVFEWGCYRG